jgi:L-lactate dehydrogenase complex protein LldE
MVTLVVEFAGARCEATGVPVGLFITCFNDTLFPDVGKATVTVLERLGVEVDFPAAQTCCGQMHFNSGYRAECVPLVRHFADVFGGYEAVVTPSASCAAMVRHYHRTVDPAVQTPRVYELTEFLVDVVGVTDVGAFFPHTVALHQTCHSLRLLRVGDRPRQLLEAVDGLTLTALRQPTECCGFGGTFSVKNADTSIAMGQDKVDDVLSTGAEVLVSADTSCLMHIGGLLSRRGAPIQVKHLAEVLAATR